MSNQIINEQSGFALFSMLSVSFVDFSLQYSHFLAFSVIIYEPRYEKTGFLHKQKQRHRSASR